ncbi:MAG: protein kinase [Lewinellaceae bacterium]|nr:protein kinase [Lewinellaceae bacterium]
MGTVYRAKDIILEREVAVKVLHEHLSRDEVLLSRFKNEALLSARINHPNVATLYQFVAVDHRDYLVMEFVHGNNLEKYSNNRETPRKDYRPDPAPVG